MPKTPTIDDQIKERIEDFTTELSELVRQAALTSIHEALGGQLAATAVKPRSAKANARKVTKKTGKGGRIRRSPADLEKLSNKVIGYVGKNPGSRLEHISAGIGLESSELKKPVAELLANKQLKKEGQKRGTTYWVLTK